MINKFQSKILFIILSVFLLSCSNTIKNEMNKDKKNNSDIYDKKINIIPLDEMESNIEIESRKFQKLDSTELSFESLENFKEKIKAIDLQKISKWAKKEMTGYILEDSFIEKTKIDSISKENESTAIIYKSISLPSHSPLVKRFLYLFVFYNSKREIEKIYVTIQGHVEE